MSELKTVPIDANVQDFLNTAATARRREDRVSRVRAVARASGTRRAGHSPGDPTPPTSPHIDIRHSAGVYVKRAR
jgi:hypothetical protein